MSRFASDGSGSVIIEYAVLAALFCIIIYTALSTLFPSDI